MTYFDTHIHLQDFEKANIIDLLKTGEISKCICVSAKQEDWSKVAFYYEQYPDMVIPAFEHCLPRHIRLKPTSL